MCTQEQKKKKHIKHEGRHKDLITEFFQLILHLRALLKQWGHKVALKASMGRTQTIEIRDGLLRGASDPRNPDGKTMGY